MDGIVDKWQPPRVILRYFPLNLCGQDKFGCPVLINAYGRLDVRGLLHHVTKEDYLRSIVYMGERTIGEMCARSKRNKKNVTQLTMIVDLQDLSMYQLLCKPGADQQTRQTLQTRLVTGY